MTATEKAKFWLAQEIDPETRQEIENLLKNDPAGLEEAFYKDLEFGTGGLRGIMGVGSNRMNKYTVGMATQGLANYLHTAFPGQEIKVAIAYDSRNNSKFFAEAAARVFAGNGIRVHIFPALRPTPELSYAIRQLGCQSGIVITASHNPKKYNGYKAYWSDGAQLTPPHDQHVINEVQKIASFAQIKTATTDELITYIDPDFDQQYIAAIAGLVLDKESIARASDIAIAYSSIHGTGITLVPPALQKIGFTNIHVVAEQAEPDGNFPTVVYPNPEEAEALTLGLQLAKEIDADLLLATDPDADRVGVAVKNAGNEWTLLNGNQMAALMAYYILKTRKQQGTLKPNQYMVKTIVTTELIDRMCAAYQIPCYNTLTGFKYIATVIRELENGHEFIGGGEESYGFMTSAIVRDKDAVAACALIAEMAAGSKNSGGLFGLLQEMYLQFGVWREDMQSITLEGKAGQEEISKMMQEFRANPPQTLGGAPVVKIMDYQALTAFDLENNTRTPLDFPVSNVLQFITASGYKVSARPSGTEPKIKFYFSVNAKAGHIDEIPATQTHLQRIIKQIKKDLNLPSS